MSRYFFNIYSKILILRGFWISFENSNFAPCLRFVSKFKFPAMVKFRLKIQNFAPFHKFWIYIFDYIFKSTCNSSFLMKKIKKSQKFYETQFVYNKMHFIYWSHFSFNNFFGSQFQTRSESVGGTQWLVFFFFNLNSSLIPLYTNNF